MKRQLSRKDFLKQIAAGTLLLPFLMKNLENILKAEIQQPLVWLFGNSSRINQPGLWNEPEFTEFISKHFKLLSLDIFSSELKHDQISNNKEAPIIILDGYFFKNKTVNYTTKIKEFLNNSRAIILLGNEVAFNFNQSERNLNIESDIINSLRIPYLKLPGIPVPAGHLLSTLNYMLLYGLPDLDEFRRPLMFYGEKICDRCEFRKDFDEGNFVEFFGQKAGCLFLLGCKGPVTKNNCPVEKLNHTSNWCVGAGSPCTGCSNPLYPDHNGLGMFGQVSSNRAAVNSFLVRNSDKLAWGSLAVTSAGIALHAFAKKTTTPKELNTLNIFNEEGD